MNIIRTTAIELSTIPAIAYKQKLASGGAGIKIFRLDRDVSAVFTIDRRTGGASPFKRYDAELFPDEAVIEALEQTSGMPYTARGKFRITLFEETVDIPEAAAGAAGGSGDDAEDVAETDENKSDMVESDEYKAIIERYTDEKGKINYLLMNKDFMQFASKSKTVADMVANKADAVDIVLFIVKSRATFISGKKESLNDGQVAALIETLDEIDPRSAFKELTAYIIRLLAKK